MATRRFFKQLSRPPTRAPHLHQSPQLAISQNYFFSRSFSLGVRFYFFKKEIQQLIKGQGQQHKRVYGNILLLGHQFKLDVVERPAKGGHNLLNSGGFFRFGSGTEVIQMLQNFLGRQDAVHHDVRLERKLPANVP